MDSAWESPAECVSRDGRGRERAKWRKTFNEHSNLIAQLAAVSAARYFRRVINDALRPLDDPRRAITRRRNSRPLAPIRKEIHERIIAHSSMKISLVATGKVNGTSSLATGNPRTQIRCGNGHVSCYPRRISRLPWKRARKCPGFPGRKHREEAAMRGTYSSFETSIRSSG